MWGASDSDVVFAAGSAGPRQRDRAISSKARAPRRRVAAASRRHQRGLDGTEDALVYAWEHWDKVKTATNPAGLLYRIGKRKAFRQRRILPLVSEMPVNDPDPLEPGLAPALRHLSKQQRIAAVLIDGFGYTYQEVADLLGVGRSTVQKHHDRALETLRREMGVNVDV